MKMAIANCKGFQWDEGNKDKNWYLNKVLEGKPITVNVKVDRETGSHEKKLKEDDA